MFSKAYVEMNSGMHDRLSENWFRENYKIFKNFCSIPEGDIAEMCEEYL